MPPASSSSASRHAQTPTCVRTRVRSTADAHKLFYAVQRGLLPLVRRRLDAEERLALAPGNVYIWEERPASADGPGPAMERFTEGKRWSQSRVREEFFFYHEKYQPPQDVVLAPNGEVQPPPDWQPLIKQTYSIITTNEARQKLHLTTYFVQASVDTLGTVDDIPGIRDLVVPPGTYIATREENKRQKRADTTKKRAKPAVATGGPGHRASSSVSPTAMEPPPLPLPHALPRSYTSFATYPVDSALADPRIPGSAMPPPALPVPLAPLATQGYQFDYGPNPYRGAEFASQTLYHHPTFAGMPPQISTGMAAASPIAPVSPSSATWGAPPLYTPTTPVYTNTTSVPRRGSIAPSEGSSSSGSGNSAASQGYRVYSPDLGTAGLSASFPAPPSAPDMYTTAFGYGYPTTPMPALPRAPMLGEQPVASGVQPPGPPPMSTGVIQPYPGDGSVEQLVPIEVLESPNTYRRGSIDEGLLRQLMVNPTRS